MVLTAALLLSGNIVLAQSSSSLSVEIHSSKVVDTQRKVDKLYEANDFKRAFFLYRNELAPLGDKYAQYMVGYMYLTGSGVVESAANASAWYQLASERGTSEFVAARDQLTRNLSQEQIIESDLLYAQLRVEFSDLVILLALVKRDFGELKTRTVTRVNSDSMSLSVVDYYGNIHERLEERLELIKKLGDFEDFETDPDNVKVRELERQVLERIEVGRL
jgi:hypothetical protein